MMCCLAARGDNDTIEGDRGTAVIDGDAGEDLLTAARGNSTIRGGDGDNVIVLSSTTFD